MIESNTPLSPHPTTAEGLASLFIDALPFCASSEQKDALHAIARFLFFPAPNKALILNGFAGTGKTSLLAAVVKVLSTFKKNTVTLAPTGRAAKVASSFSGKPASTIHRHIYRPLGNELGQKGFMLANNRLTNTLFIADEASMITDGNERDSLLRHLLRFVYSAPGCCLMFVGDVAQLPPIGHEGAPAMEPERLRSYGLNPWYISLTQTMRQGENSGILLNATLVRQALYSKTPIDLTLKAHGLTDVDVISSYDLADMLSASWESVGKDETIIITRSNKRANNYNAQLRSRVLMAEEPLQRGERLIISKNDYYWCERNKATGFLANGQTVEVAWTGGLEKAYGRYFVDAEILLPDTNTPIGVKIMLRSLMAEGPTIPPHEMQQFYRMVMDSYDGEFSEKDRATASDPYFNALQVKYAYCVTCHKAQGGQWKHVYIDLATIMPEAYGADFYRWLYTAITRATEKVFLINPSVPVA